MNKHLRDEKDSLVSVHTIYTIHAVNVPKDHMLFMYIEMLQLIKDSHA